MKKSTIAAIGTVTLLGAGLGVAQMANADEATPSPSPSASSSTKATPSDGSSSTDDSRPQRRGHGHRGGQGADLSAVAEKLGIEESTLQEAIDAQREAQRSERLTDLAERAGVDADKLIEAWDEASPQREN